MSNFKTYFKFSARFFGVSLICAGLVAGIGCGGKSEDEDDIGPIQSSTAAKKSIDPATTGGISGSVTFSGSAPKMGKLDMGADAFCAGKHADAVRDQSVIVNNNGTLKNVVVYVKKGLEEYGFPAPAAPPVLDQAGCMYLPHILLMMPGILQIRSSDQTLHNVHAEPKLNAAFNRAQPTPSTIEAKLTKAEMVPFKCDVHPWMRAYVAVIDHPVAFVTGDDGSFTLSPVPAGTVVIEAWHEKFGRQESTVTVESGKTANISLAFTAPGA